MGKQIKKLTIFGTCLFILANTVGCSSHSKSLSAMKPIAIKSENGSYKTDKVFKGSISRSGGVRGNVIFPIKSDLYFRYKGGYLKKLYVSQGATVKKGDLIAELDDADIQYSIKQQQIKTKMSELTYESLVQKNASAYEIQRAALTLESDRFQLQQLNDSLKDCQLISNIDGKVLTVAEVKQSQFISPYQFIVSIGDTRFVQLECQVKTTAIPLGTNATVQFDGMSSTFRGEVVCNTAQFGTPDEQSQNEFDRVIVNIENPPTAGLDYRQIADITVDVESKKNVLLVPNKAIIEGQGGKPVVKVLKDGEIVETFIETGIISNNFIEVISGVNEGDEVLLQ